MSPKTKKGGFKDPDVLTLTANLKKIKWLRGANLGVSYSIADKANYLLPALYLQPYIKPTEDGSLSLEYYREDGSVLNFYILDEPMVHMVATLVSSDGDRSYIRQKIEPSKCNEKVLSFYELGGV